MNLQKKNYLTFCKILFDKNNEAQKLKNIELFKPSFDRNKILCATFNKIINLL
jgi:hypothetical protein